MGRLYQKGRHESGENRFGIKKMVMIDKALGVFVELVMERTVYKRSRAYGKRLFAIINCIMIIIEH